MSESEIPLIGEISTNLRVITHDLGQTPNLSIFFFVDMENTTFNNPVCINVRLLRRYHWMDTKDTSSDLPKIELVIYASSPSFVTTYFQFKIHGIVNI